MSDSEEEGEEEEEDDYGAQDAAVRAAQLDGATVERIISSKAAGGSILAHRLTGCITEILEGSVWSVLRLSAHLLAAICV